MGKRRKYLEKAGIKRDAYDWGDRKDKRWKKWQKQQKKYGFDERECWDLDQTFYFWLYERLHMYLKGATGIVDLTYHQFDYNGKKYSQLDLIEMMLKRLEYSFSDDYDDFDETEFQFVHEIEKIWAVILPSMWW